MIIGTEEKLTTFSSVCIRFLFNKIDIRDDVERMKNVEVSLLGNHFSKYFHSENCYLKF